MPKPSCRHPTRSICEFALMLSDRVTLDACNQDGVSVRIRVLTSPWRVAVLVALGTAVAFGSIALLLNPLALFFVGIVIAMCASVCVFCGVQWLLHGYERYSTSGSKFTYEWRVPGAGLGSIRQFETAQMGPIHCTAQNRVGFMYQNKFIRLGKALHSSQEAQEFVDVMASYLPASLVSQPAPVAVTVCDAYYPMDTTSKTAPTALPVAQTAAAGDAPVPNNVRPAEAHI
ncbi:unnamed protein product [Aphanomyces euteiches]